MGLLVENKTIAVPGDVLAEGMDYLPGENAFRDGEKIYSSRVGLVSVDGRAVKIIPLAGTYLPKAGDRIICKVFDLTYSAWRVDTNTAYPAMLSMMEASNSYIEKGANLHKILTINDWIVAKILNVTGQNLLDITLKAPGLGKLKPGRIIEVSPVKVPRIIGKQGSMVSMIKDATKCQITVGQNGLIWISGLPEDELIAVETIQKIENEAHTSGLTETIDAFLKSKGKTSSGINNQQTENSEEENEL